MNKLYLRVAIILLGLIFGTTNTTAAPGPFALLHSLFDPSTNAQTGALHGQSVAVAGNLAVVGAPGENHGAAASGAVRVYDATTGALQHTLTNPSPAAGDWFGNAVAISGTRMVVGAYQDDTGRSGAGSAYVYDLALTVPAASVLTLTNPTPTLDERFGSSVAISGTRLVVGVPYDSTGIDDAGRAYVYDLASGTPAVPVTTLHNPTPEGSDHFGFSVAIFGNRVVIGATLDDTGGTNTGCVYVYDLAGGTPTTPMFTLTNPSPAFQVSFGGSVAVSDRYVVVGVPYALAGRAYVYDLTSSTALVPLLTLHNPNPGTDDLFGGSVAISGTRIVIGSERSDTIADNVGVAYVYDLAGPTPAVPITPLANPGPAFNDRFGNSVAVDGATILVGTPNDDADDRGAAYIFGLVPALRIAPAAPGLATLSWTPATSSGFALQYADALAPDEWHDAPSGALNPVTISLNDGARFYRLRAP